jgi:general secretion pathway protein F
MKNFRYRCIDDKGQRREGSISATDPRAAERELRDRGWTLLSLDGETAASPAAPARVSLSGVERARFLLKLSLLLDAGLPILSSLESSAQDEPAHLADWIGKVSATVSGGHPLSEAMARQPVGFDSSTIAVVRLGEQTGTLSSLLRQLAVDSQRELDRASELKAKMVYPAVQLVVASLLCVLMGAFMGPRLMEILSSLGEDQPVLTRLVMRALSPSVMGPLGFLVLGCAVVIGLSWSTPAGKTLRLRLVEQIPPLQRLRREFALVRFCRSLAMMLECGFNWQHTLALLESADDDPLGPAIKLFRERLSEGDLPDALGGIDEFPPLFCSLLLSGYESNSISPFLLLYANMLDEALQRRIVALLTLLEPLLLLVMGLVVGVIVIASFMPILNLVQKL